jgi:hypothetical protein
MLNMSSKVDGNKGRGRWLVLMLVTLPCSVLAQQTLSAAQIMALVDARYAGDSITVKSRLTLIDKNKRERHRLLQRFTRKFDGNEKSLSFVLSPADLYGTGYLNLSHDNADLEDDSWLYLPALKQIKRIAATEKSAPFLGSDFSFTDINGTDVNWYNYTMLDESVEVDGVDTWHILSEPKPGLAQKVIEETGYTRSHLWVRKDNYIQVKAKIWLKNPHEIKYFSASELENIDGIWTAKRVQMVSTRNGKFQHASVFLINEISYNQPVSAQMFIPATLTKGPQKQ